MRLLGTVTAILVLTAGVAQARVPAMSMPQVSTSKVFAQRATVRTPASTKFAEAWVLHNPYKPQTIKLSFVN